MKFIIYIILIVIIAGVFYDQNSKIKNDRLLQVAYSFINYPYKVNPIKCSPNEYVPNLSEIKNFDCVTYVETVLAKYRVTDFKKNIQKMRYKNSINSCQNRNHFFIAEWMPNNPLFKFSNITKNIIAQNKITKKNIKIDKSTWFREKHNLLTSEKVINFMLEYVSFDDFLNSDINNSKDKFPNISLMVITNNKDDIDINHIGFLIKNKNDITFLHASYTNKKITEENIFKYLLNLKKNPTFKGIAIFKIENKNNLHY